MGDAVKVLVIAGVVVAVLVLASLGMDFNNFYTTGSVADVTGDSIQDVSGMAVSTSTGESGKGTHNSADIFLPGVNKKLNEVLLGMAMDISATKSKVDKLPASGSSGAPPVAVSSGPQPTCILVGISDFGKSMIYGSAEVKSCTDNGMDKVEVKLSDSNYCVNNVGSAEGCNHRASSGTLALVFCCSGEETSDPDGGLEINTVSIAGGGTELYIKTNKLDVSECYVKVGKKECEHNGGHLKNEAIYGDVDGKMHPGDGECGGDGTCFYIGVKDKDGCNFDGKIASGSGATVSCKRKDYEFTKRNVYFV